jgi:stage II sporulation protein D
MDGPSRAPAGFAVSRRRKPDRRADRRLAAVVVALAAVTGALVVGGPSCVPAATPRADLSIPRELAGAPLVRVALARPLASGRAAIEVRGPYAIYASDAKDARPSFAGDALGPAEVSLEAGGAGLVFAGHVFRPPVARVTAERPGTLVVDGAAYRGDLVVRPAPPGAVGERGLLVLDRVNLEEYTAGVIGGEMPLLYPDAALRAQAVASRTYGLHAARSRAGEAWDVLDDTSSQVYRGVAAEGERGRQATLDTMGVVLTWRGEIFKSYFHSTCGGRTASNATAFGEAEVPPLAGVPCGFCDDGKHARWRVEVPRAEVAAKLAKDAPSLRGLAKLDVLETFGDGGRVATVRATGTDGRAFGIPAARFRAAIGAGVVQSTWFAIEDAGGASIAFAGRGWGHGVGLCQAGARGMAQAGYDATAILGRYYPGADLVSIYSKAAGAEVSVAPGGVAR